MAIIHGLVAHGTTIVAEYKTDRDIDDLTDVKQTNWPFASKCLNSLSVQNYSRTGYSGKDTTK